MVFFQFGFILVLQNNYGFMILFCFGFQKWLCWCRMIEWILVVMSYNVMFISFHSNFKLFDVSYISLLICSNTGYIKKSGVSIVFHTSLASLLVFHWVNSPSIWPMLSRILIHNPFHTKLKFLDFLFIPLFFREATRH